MKLAYTPDEGTIANIDGDVLVYRIGFTTEDASEDIAMVRMNAYIDEIVFKSRASTYNIFLSAQGKANFRMQVYPHYKANRPPKPKHYGLLRQYLIDVEAAYVSENMEADDELGINQTDSTIICSIDKDLLMIPGRHYNFVKDKHSYVTPEEGTRNFYRQLLTGDKTDNIPGIYGIGPVKAEAMLGSYTKGEEYKGVVFDAYKAYFPYCDTKEVLAHINMVGKLLWIKRTPDEEYMF